jgi:hypothetical protein
MDYFIAVMLAPANRVLRAMLHTAGHLHICVLLDKRDDSHQEL